jgi:hypothetical protein
MACLDVVSRTDCVFYDPTPATFPNEPTSVHVPLDDLVESIATLRHFPPGSYALLTDLTEVRPLIRTELNVKTFDDRQLISKLVDCASTLNFVSILNHANTVSVEDNLRKRSYIHSPANGTITATTSLHALCRDNISGRAVA